MAQRLDVKVPEDMLLKLREIEAIRQDLKGYRASKQVLVLLQEAIKANLNKQANSKSALNNGPVM